MNESAQMKRVENWVLANVKKANLETIFLQLFELIYSKQQCILEPESRSKEHIIKY